MQLKSSKPPRLDSRLQHKAHVDLDQKIQIQTGSGSNASSVKHDGGGVVAWSCVAATGAGSLIFIDYITADRS